MSQNFEKITSKKNIRNDLYRKDRGTTHRNNLSREMKRSDFLNESRDSPEDKVWGSL
jgi:hypothetical protein